MPLDPERVAAVFEQALAKPTPRERAAYLDQACGDDAELRRRVTELLAAHEAAPESFLPLPETDVTADGPAIERPGSNIGPYKLLQLIGEGGFGSVFMAEQERPVRRRVALKIIKLGMDTRQVIARFEAERQALALMDHPHVAKVFDAGAAETGRPYFVMELVKGVAITEYCDKHNLSIERRLELFTQVCQAVQHAHQKGLIHRDIKPSNVLVATQDDHPMAKVIDFGIAKATQARLTEKTFFTEFHQWIGTPEYMSPEQAECSLDIDTRSDVYSLGVLLYELLAGSPPFDARQLRSQAYVEIQRIIREVEPPRPSMKLSGSANVASLAACRGGVAPKRLHTLVQGELDWIVMCCLEKDRARRYPSANALATDILHYLADEPVQACSPSKIYRMRKFVRRNKGPVIASAIVLAVLIAGITGTTLGLIGQSRLRMLANNQRLIAEHQGDEARKQAAEARNQAAIADAVRQFQADMLTAADPQRLLGDKVTVFQAMTAAVQQLDAGQLKDQPLVEAFVREAIGDTLRALGRYDTAEPNFRRALDLRRKFQPPGHPDIAGALNRLASLLQDENKLAEAEPLFREALEITLHAVPAEELNIAASLNNLGELLNLANRPSAAEPLFRQSLDILRKALPPQDPTIGVALNNLASVLLAEQKHTEAEALFREGVHIYRKFLPPGSPRLANGLNNLAELLRREGNLEEAENLLRESLAIRSQALPAGHQLIGQALNNVAVVVMARGHLDEAESLLRRALAIRRKAFRAGHSDITQSVLNLARALCMQGKFPEAETLSREGLNNSRGAVPPRPAEVGLSLNCLAMALKGQGKAVEAERYSRELLEFDRGYLPADHSDIARDLNCLAMALIDQGRLADAEPLARDSVRLLGKDLAPESSDLATALSVLGLVLQRERKFADAEPLYRQALTIRRRLQPADHPDVIDSLAIMAGLHFEQGRQDEAVELYREALAIARKALSPGHPLVPRTLSGLASALRAQKKFADAEPLAREAIATFEHTLGKDSAPMGSTRFELARILAALNRRSEAESEFIDAERILATAAGALPQRHAECVAAMVSFYADWDKSEPGKGYEAKAQSWQAKLPASRPATTTSAPQ